MTQPTKKIIFRNLYDKCNNCSIFNLTVKQCSDFSMCYVTAIVPYLFSLLFSIYYVQMWRNANVSDIRRASRGRARGRGRGTSSSSPTASGSGSTPSGPGSSSLPPTPPGPAAAPPPATPAAPPPAPPAAPPPPPATPAAPPPATPAAPPAPQRPRVSYLPGASERPDPDTREVFTLVDGIQ